MQRFGQRIQLNPSAIATYERLHAAVWPEVLATIAECHLRNYTIFRDDLCLFAYFEYVGDDYAADMAKMAADPKTQEWWRLAEPLQVPLPDRADGEWGKTIPAIFHVD